MYVPSVHRPNCTRGEENIEVCACDPQCAPYGDCCRSSPYFVPEEQRLGASPFTCMNLFGTRLYVMTRCPPDWKEPNTRDRCEHPDTNYSDPLLDAPVTSRSTNITYRNWHCASCHRDLDANTTVIWDAQFECHNYRIGLVSYETLEEELTYNPSTSRWNLNVSKSSDVESSMSPPRNVQTSDNELYECDLQFTAPTAQLPARRCKPGVVNSCSENWKETAVKTQCEAYTAHICSGWDTYRNHHCLVCNGLFPPNSCDTAVYVFSTGLPESFTILLDWQRLRRGVCAPSEIYDSLSRVCRKVFNWEFSNEICENILSHLHRAWDKDIIVWIIKSSGWCVIKDFCY
jgi:hypothetical protein